MNHNQRESIVNSTWNGNHINQPPEDVSREIDPELVECTECGNKIIIYDYELNSGLCLNCIKCIGDIK